MGGFFFWPINGVSASKVSLWYFKILSRFYLYILLLLVLHHRGCLQWFSMSHLGHSSHSAASDGSASALNLSGSLLLQDFCKLSWSIFNGPLLLFQPEATFFILCLEKLNQPGGETPLLFCWGWGRRSDFAGSDVRWVHNLFSIIETPTTNQGKRGSMSYIILFHWQPFKAIIYFSVLIFDMNLTFLHCYFYPPIS